ncbi:hypothetical protein LDG_5346 [Legionella drancourtii LLAP12]|uniref:histidine kinase n=2 Tax=Legionella drancourtii TaxID=168933 RepID=G9EJI3_9GAMM|nr:hypothetical protein LDG_5346 [Legionella drancourtii LLAP12]
MHLLDNAIKFSVPKSNIQLSVQLKEEHVIVSIEDFGLEIAIEERKKLFKKFYCGKKALEEHGLGLGLAICEKIIAAHDGTIWVEQIANKRTAFRFALPVNSKD